MWMYLKIQYSIKFYAFFITLDGINHFELIDLKPSEGHGMLVEIKNVDWIIAFNTEHFWADSVLTWRLWI